MAPRLWIAVTDPDPRVEDGILLTVYLEREEIVQVKLNRLEALRLSKKLLVVGLDRYR